MKTVAQTADPQEIMELIAQGLLTREGTLSLELVQRTLGSFGVIIDNPEDTDQWLRDNLNKFLDSIRARSATSSMVSQSQPHAESPLVSIPVSSEPPTIVEVIAKNTLGLGDISYLSQEHVPRELTLDSRDDMSWLEFLASLPNGEVLLSHLQLLESVFDNYVPEIQSFALDEISNFSTILFNYLESYYSPDIPKKTRAAQVLADIINRRMAGKLPWKIVSHDVGQTLDNTMANSSHSSGESRDLRISDIFGWAEVDSNSRVLYKARVAASKTGPKPLLKISQATPSYGISTFPVPVFSDITYFSKSSVPNDLADDNVSINWLDFMGGLAHGKILLAKLQEVHERVQYLHEKGYNEYGFQLLRNSLKIFSKFLFEELSIKYPTDNKKKCEIAGHIAGIFNAEIRNKINLQAISYNIGKAMDDRRMSSTTQGRKVADVKSWCLSALNGNVYDRAKVDSN